MDVKKLFVLTIVLLFAANCEQRRAATSNPKFEKTSDRDCSGENLPGEYLVHWKNGEITVEKFANDESFVKDFVEVHKDEIIVAEPHFKIQMETQVELSQRGWGGYPNWGMDVSRASELWAMPARSNDIVVAVIDSGVDINHPELVDAIYVNQQEIANGLDDDGNGLVDDINGYDFVADSGEVIDYTGHGTHVAGVIGARHNVGEITGVAPNVRILPLAFISKGGGGSVQAAINSIRYAASQNARVINASWGGPTCSTVLKAEIEALASQNVLFVTAAGNSGNNISDFPEYPAAFVISNMLTVGASALDDFNSSQVMAIFSNFGDLVEVMAPGAAITSTYPPEFDNEDGSFDGLATINGTSMATPHVAGAAALLWSLKPDASYLEIKQALMDGVSPGPFRVKTRGSLYLPTAHDILTQ